MKKIPQVLSRDVFLGDRIEAIVDEGIRISGKRVARLMRHRSICQPSRRMTTTTTMHDRDAKADN